MDITGPPPVQLYNVQPTTAIQGVQDAVQHNLLPHQMILATVVESSGRQVLLDMGHQQLKAQTEVELQQGQKLNLQVVTTDPQLKLQVVSPSADNQLLRLLHLYDHRTEIGSTLTNLLGQRYSVSVAPPTAPVTVPVNGSPQASSPVAPPTAAVTTTTAEQAALPSSTPTSPAPANTVVADPRSTVVPATPAQSTSVPAPVVAAPPGAPVNAAASAEALPLPSTNGGGTSAAPTGGQVATAPSLPEIAGGTPLRTEFTAVGGRTAQPAVVVVEADVTQNDKAVVPTTLAALDPQQMSAVTTVLHRLDAGSTVANALFTAINLVPLTNDQRKTLESSLTPQQWETLETLADELMADFKGNGTRILLGLAHGLGLDYEALLAQQKSDQAGQSLKGAMMTLAENDDLPETVRESSRQLVQQLELLQLTRARFAQEGVLFVPLPFEFMEQGYALIEQRGGDREERGLSHVVTINMSLEGLGAVQANLLFEQQALFVRILCENDASQQALEGEVASLEQALSPFAVRSIQIAQGAEDPAIALINRLQPHRNSVLDARV